MTLPAEIPVIPKKALWTQKDDPERLVRIFTFDRHERLTDFVNEIFGLERRMGHHGVITIAETTCKISVWTKGICSVTEIDVEYANAVSNIFDDVSMYEY